MDVLLLMSFIAMVASVGETGAGPVVFNAVFLLAFIFATLKVKQLLKRIRSKPSNEGESIEKEESSYETFVENAEQVNALPVNESHEVVKKESDSVEFFDGGNVPLPEGYEKRVYESFYGCYAELYWITYKCLNGGTYRLKCENMMISRNYLSVKSDEASVLIRIPLKSIVTLEDGSNMITEDIPGYIRKENKRLRR